MQKRYDIVTDIDTAECRLDAREIDELKRANTQFMTILYIIVEAVHLAHEARNSSFTAGLTNAKYAN